MAKRTSYFRCFMTGATVNGRKLADVDYERIEYADGTVKESGKRPEELLAELTTQITSPRKRSKAKGRSH